ncbi:MAG: dihydroorotase [Limisphaerales bacterium]|jgi:dihydroorotase
MQLDLPKWFDLHTHFRQGPAMPAYLKAHLEMGCAGVLAMPNTKPPIARVVGEPNEQSWTIEQYLTELKSNGGADFEQIIVPLYLTRETTPDMISEGAASGLLRACKYYPPHGTTNSEHGLPMDKFLGGAILRTMEEQQIVLCIHGEQHALSGEDYLAANRNAEAIFYRETMPRLLDQHPNLRIVCEHITTQDAAKFVQAAPERVAATITPQHLLYTIGHLIQGLKYHLYCLPIVKFEEDRAALREAVADPEQNQFFAGTDSAPHTTKATDCGCAAGCFTGGCAPQLYAMAFEQAGIDLGSQDGFTAFERFLSLNGPAFYGFPASDQRFSLVKTESDSAKLSTPDGDVTPLPLGMNLQLTWSLK